MKPSARPFIIMLSTLAVMALVGVIAYVIAPRQAPQKPTPSPPPPIAQKPAPPKVVEAKPAPEKPPQKEVKKPEKPKVVAALDPNKVVICPNSQQTGTLAEDGTLFGHHPYADAMASDLSEAPEGFGNSNCKLMHGEAKIALEALIAAARAHDPEIAEAMIGLSCFRSSTYQREVFCRKVSEGLKARARVSAPPGFSEHATGYAIDFGDRNVPECNLLPCFADTPVGQWLAANGAAHGFVLSFPKGNAQGVVYEPWHWRYEKSPAAQAIFAGAL